MIKIAFYLLFVAIDFETEFGDIYKLFYSSFFESIMSRVIELGLRLNNYPPPPTTTHLVAGRGALGFFVRQQLHSMYLEVYETKRIGM